jgi:hypothetical protein
MGYPEYESDSIVDINGTPTLLLLTSEAEMQEQFSALGVNLHIDDVNPADDNYDHDNDPAINKAEVIKTFAQRATSHVMSYLAPRFAIENIYRIPRLREIATIWACYKISRRRGNESVYEEEYLENEAELEAYRNGTRYLAAPVNGQRGVVQSYVIDNRYSYNSCRVLPQASTQVVGGQALYSRYAAFRWL